MYHSEVRNFPTWPVIGFLAFAAVLTAVGMVGCPKYRVYQQRLHGEAVLAHAKSTREVAIAEAKAKMESAVMLAEAEVTRAKGVAKANEIIGASLKENTAYLQYLWINQLEANNPTVIYVPHDGGLPLMEAGRTPRPSTKQ